MHKVKKIQRRTAELELKNGAENQVIEFSFSSEFPVERMWGKEILSHAPGAMDLSRLKASAPVLFNHNRDIHVGVVEDAWIGDDKRGYCRMKFSRSEIGQEKCQDVQDKVLVNVSFGYEIKDLQVVGDGSDQIPSFLVTEYQPFEISLVTIPADFTVGMGRSMDEELEIEAPAPPEKTEDVESAAVVEEVPAADTARSLETDTPNKNIKAVKNDSKNLNIAISERKPKMEQREIEKAAEQRVMSILNLGEKHEEKEMARQFIENGKSAADFALALVDKLGGRQTVINDKPVEMTDKEKQSYSVTRAMNAIINKDWSKAGFELEVSNTLAKRSGKETTGFYMPTNIQTRAALNATSAAAGGNTVQTSVLGDQFIDVLRNRAVLVSAGATVLSGLTGNIAIPRKNGRSTAYWVAENGTITESEVTFDQVSFSPKTVAALTAFSKQLLQQSSLSVDAMVSDDLNKELALAIDLAGLAGTGSGGQPTGVLNKSGIGSVAMGTNGAALTFDALIDMETAVNVANADGASMKYITNSTQVGKLKKLKDSQGQYLWSARDNGSPALFTPGQMNGYDVMRTNQIPSNLTKGTASGVCSAVLFGDWSQLVIAQFMSGIEILVNPYGTSFAKGGVDVRAMAMVDMNVRQAAAFCAISDAL